MPRLIGYWRSLDDPDWPDPGTFVDRDWDLEEQALVANYLDTAPGTGAVSAGLTFCRFGCGMLEGSTERTDGHYIWPETLSHYITDHFVRLPDEFIEHVKAIKKPLKIIHPEGTKADGSWWRKQKGPFSEKTFWTPQRRGRIWFTGFSGPSPAKAAAFLRSWPTLKDISLKELMNLVENPELMTPDSFYQPMRASRSTWEKMRAKAHWVGVHLAYEDEDILNSAALQACRAFNLPDRIEADDADSACRVMLLPSLDTPIVFEIRQEADKTNILMYYYDAPSQELIDRYLNSWPPPADTTAKIITVESSLVKPIVDLRQPPEQSEKVKVLDGNWLHWSAPNCSRSPSWWEALIGGSESIDKANKILTQLFKDG